MRKLGLLQLTTVILTALSVSGLTLAADAGAIGEPGRDSGKPNPLKNVYFGEQHLHTQNSPDAFAAGSRQTWDEAFRYGRGEEVTLHTIATKNKIKRRTPYDFMAITDHAEYFSVMAMKSYGVLRLILFLVAIVCSVTSSPRP